MIPTGDNTSRSLLLRRVSSWSQVTCNTQPQDANAMNHTNTPNGGEGGPASSSDDSFSLGSTSTGLPQEQQPPPPPLLQLELETNVPTPVVLLPELEYELPERRTHGNDFGYSLLADQQQQQQQQSSWKMQWPWRKFSSIWKRSKKVKLGFGCFILVLSGVCNVILAKLQSVPMYNYPTFLNLYANFMYIPISFAYIIPATYYGWFQNSIPYSHWKISKTPFLIMGALDSISAAMQVLSSVYLPGTLLVLLPQAAIPFSIIASKTILKEQFTRMQYIGAIVVFFGIIVVLFPVIITYRSTVHRQHHNTSSFILDLDEEDDLQEEKIRHDTFLVFFWSLIMLASCIPMTFSSIYKQVALTTITQRNVSTRRRRRRRSTNNDNRNDQSADLICEDTTALDGEDDHNNNTMDDDIGHDDHNYEDINHHQQQRLLPSSSAATPLLSTTNNTTTEDSEPSTLDPIFVNGWVSIFQFLFALPLAIPAGLVSSPSVAPWELPSNWYHAIKCMFQHVNSIVLDGETSRTLSVAEDATISHSSLLFFFYQEDNTNDFRHPDNCHQAVLWVHLGLLSGIAYTISIICMLKYGSSALLYMALTVMVPLGHLVFAVHSPSSIQVSDVIGLCILLIGLICYRFGHDDNDDNDDDNNVVNDEDVVDDDVVIEDDGLGTIRVSTLPTIEVSSSEITTNDPTIAFVVGEREIPNHMIRNRHRRNRSSQTEDYWAFLREPFVLSGDV